MKKVILIMTGLFATVAGFSQANKSNGADAASKPNSGIVEPTINGKPYSQYKAEQDALKQADAAQNKTVVLHKDVQFNGGTGAVKTAASVPNAESQAKLTPQSHTVVMPTQNAAVTTSSKTEVSQPKGDKDVVAEKIVVATNSSQQATNPLAPKMAPVNSVEKSGESNSNGTSPAKVETKTADPVVPGANRKTD